MNFNSIKIGLIMCSLTFFGCTKNSERAIICSQSIPPLYLNFNVVDKSTGADYFFSPTPAFSIKDMYFFKIHDVTRKDTIRPDVDGIGLSRSFRLRLDNTKLNDTLIVKVGNTPESRLIHKLKQSQDVCPEYVIDKILFNDLEIPSVNTKYILRN